ncbi:hypothetical protein EDD15DRAFT_1631233 [Pisolithus albus]|nr:hypothetical protein EDD15DRAFT_1631233 [Pisolithus albus]
MVPNPQLCCMFSFSLYERYSSFTASLYSGTMGSTSPSGRGNFVHELAELEGARAPHDVGSRTRNVGAWIRVAVSTRTATGAGGPYIDSSVCFPFEESVRCVHRSAAQRNRHSQIWHLQMKNRRRNPSQSQNLLDEYCEHCELFPTTLPLTHDTINYLKDVLIQASGGMVYCSGDDDASPLTWRAERIMLKYSRTLDIRERRSLGQGSSEDVHRRLR